MSVVSDWARLWLDVCVYSSIELKPVSRLTSPLKAQVLISDLCMYNTYVRSFVNPRAIRKVLVRSRKYIYIYIIPPDGKCLFTNWKPVFFLARG